MPLSQLEKLQQAAPIVNTLDKKVMELYASDPAKMEPVKQKWNILKEKFAKKRGMLYLNYQGETTQPVQQAGQEQTAPVLNQQPQEQTIKLPEVKQADITNFTKGELEQLTPIVNAMQNLPKGSPELQNAISIYNQQIKDIQKARYDQAVNNTTMEQPPSLPPGVAGIATGVVSGVSAGRDPITLYQQKLEESAKDLRLSKDARESLRSYANTTKAMFDRIQSDPAYKNTKGVTEFAAMAVPLGAINKLTAFVKLGKLAPELSKTALSAIKLADNMVRGGLTGAAYGAIEELPAGESRTKKILENAVLFSVLDVAMGIPGANKIARAKNIKEALNILYPEATKPIQEKIIKLQEDYGSLGNDFWYNPENIKRMDEMLAETERIRNLAKSPQGKKWLNDNLTLEEKTSIEKKISQTDEIPIIESNPAPEQYPIIPSTGAYPTNYRTTAENKVYLDRGEVPPTEFNPPRERIVYAEETGKQTQAGSGKEGPAGGEGGQVYLRDAEKNRLEAEQAQKVDEIYQKSDAFQKSTILEHRANDSTDPVELEWVFNKIVKRMPNESRIVYALSKNKNTPEKIAKLAEERYNQIFRGQPETMPYKQEIKPVDILLSRSGTKPAKDYENDVIKFVQEQKGNLDPVINDLTERIKALPKTEEGIAEKLKLSQTLDMIKQASGKSKASPEGLVEKVAESPTPTPKTAPEATQAVEAGAKVGQAEKPVKIVRGKGGETVKNAKTLEQEIRNRGGLALKPLEDFGINTKENKGLRMRIGRKNGIAPDVMANDLIENGIIPPAPKDVPEGDWLIQNIFGKGKQPAKAAEEQGIRETVNSMSREGTLPKNVTSDQMAEILRKDIKTEEVPAFSIKQGDEFTVAGEKYKVVADDGKNLTLKDGTEVKVSTEDNVVLDKGSLKETATVEQLGNKTEELGGSKQLNRINELKSNIKDNGNILLDEYTATNGNMIIEYRFKSDPKSSKRYMTVFKDGNGTTGKAGTKPSSLEQQFIEEQAKKGTDIRKVQTMETKLANREKVKAKLEADKAKGQEDIFAKAEESKQTDLLSGAEFTKGLFDAAKKDVNNPKLGIAAGDPYANIRKFLDENKLKLTDEERKRIIDYTSRLVKQGYGEARLQEKFDAFISRELPKINQPIVERQPLIRRESGMRPADKIISMMEKQRVREQEMKNPVKPSNIAAKLSDIKTKFKIALSSELQPIVDLQRKLEKRNNSILRPDESPEYSISLFNGIYGKVENNLKELENIFSSTGDVNSFRNYMELQKYIERANLGLRNPNGITAEEAINTLNEMAQNNPEVFTKLKNASKELKKFNDKILDYYADSGMISKESADLLKDKYQYYVPFRVLDYLDVEGGRFGAKTFNISKEDLIKIQKGTEREVGDVLGAYMDKMQMMVNRAERNKVAQKVADMKNQFADDPNISDFIQEVKPGTSPDFGKETFNALIDGQRHTYMVDKDLGDAMKRLNSKEIDIITKTVGFGTRALRAGATMYNLSFSLPNVVRDYLNAKVISPYGLNVVNWGNGFVSSIKEMAGIKDDLYRSFLENGGAFSTFEKHFNPDVFLKRAQRKALGKKFTINSVNPLEWIRLFNNSLEEATRVGVYRQALKKSKDVTEAAFWARNATVDFNRVGSVGRVANLWVPFLNARIQGTRNIIKSLNDRPIATGAKISTFIGVPAAVTYIWNRGFAEFDQIPDWEKKKYFIVITGKYIDANGESKPTYVRFPKGDVGEVFGSLAENAMEYMLYKHPENFYEIGKKIMGDFVGQATGSVLPISGNIAGSLTPVIKVPVEWGANYNFFREQPVVPDWLKEAKPSEQYNYKTSALAKNVGKAFNVSPLKIDNAIYGTFGGASKYVLTVPNFWLADDKSRSEYEKIAGIPGIEAFIGKSGYGQLEKKYSDLKKYQEQSATKSVTRFREATELFNQYKELSGADRNKFLSELKIDDPKLLNTFKGFLRDEELGLSTLEKNIKKLEPTTRAEYIADVLSDKSGTELKNILIDYQSKGIITKEVLSRLKELGIMNKIQARNKGD